MLRNGRRQVADDRPHYPLDGSRHLLILQSKKKRHHQLVQALLLFLTHKRANDIQCYRQALPRQVKHTLNGRLDCKGLTRALLPCRPPSAEHAALAQAQGRTKSGWLLAATVCALATATAKTRRLRTIDQHESACRRRANIAFTSARLPHLSGSPLYPPPFHSAPGPCAAQMREIQYGHGGVPGKTAYSASTISTLLLYTVAT